MNSPPESDPVAAGGGRTSVEPSRRQESQELRRGYSTNRAGAKIYGITRHDEVELRRTRRRHLYIVLEIAPRQRVGVEQRLGINGQNLKCAQAPASVVPRACCADDLATNAKQIHHCQRGDGQVENAWPAGGA